MRKRLDPRRNTKPKKPDAQLYVCTPFDPSAFHFGKISNPEEVLLNLQLDGAGYKILTNKFPLFPCHMLLVAEALVPQQLTLGHLRAVAELVRPSSFCAYFNSWRASASVNHFHCHLIDEMPPVTRHRLVPHAAPPPGFPACLTPEELPGTCYVLPWAERADEAAAAVHAAVVGMQRANQPHNLLVTPYHVYLWPKPIERPAESFDLYPETVGGPELIGSFTVYQRADFERLSAADAASLYALNTAPPVSVPAVDTGDIDAACAPGSADAAKPAAAEPHTTGRARHADTVETQCAAAPPRELDFHKSPPPGQNDHELLKLLTPRAATGWSGRRRDAGGGA